MNEQRGEHIDRDTFSDDDDNPESLDSISHLDVGYLTSDLPGIGGDIKKTDESFEVEEIPAFRLSNNGPFIHVKTRRINQNTRSIVTELSSLFSIDEKQIGYCGLKDRHAVATQSFSLMLPEWNPEDVQRRINDNLDLDAIESGRHDRPLRLGYFSGNHFRIVLSDSVKDDRLVRDIQSRIERDGIPNFYGPQRFGVGGCNASEGLAILRGEKKHSGWKRDFLLSAAQSELFNRWLHMRIERDDFRSIIPGDVAQKTSGGGIFPVKDIVKESGRFNDHQIVYTGPIYGYRMKRPILDEEKYESDILNRYDLAMKHFRKSNLIGARRAALYYVKDMSVNSIDDGYEFAFTLPPGAYATVVLREFQKA